MKAETMKTCVAIITLNIFLIIYSLLLVHHQASRSRSYHVFSSLTAPLSSLIFFFLLHLFSTNILCIILVYLFIYLFVSLFTLMFHLRSSSSNSFAIKLFNSIFSIVFILFSQKLRINLGSMFFFDQVIQGLATNFYFFN